MRLPDELHGCGGALSALLSYNMFRLSVRPVAFLGRCKEFGAIGLKSLLLYAVLSQIANASQA